jgi:branched-chain amino acid transport system substrate-binding protein
MLVGSLSLLMACGSGRDEVSPAETKSITPGITETSIKLGTSMPLTGPGGQFGTMAQSAQAYFKSVNDAGGINGRTIDYTILDDAYDTARTVDNVRRLVEQEKVFAVFQILGTPTNLAVWDYLEEHKVPQLYSWTSDPVLGNELASGTKHWAMTFPPPFPSQAEAQAEYLSSLPGDHKVAMLFQNGDFGQAVVESFEPALKNVGIETVAKEGFEGIDPSVDSQVVNLESSGADVLLNWNFAVPASQAIKKANQLGWKPTIILSDAANGISSVLKPAGLKASNGVVSNAFLKDPSDPTWASDADLAEYKAVLKKYAPNLDANSPQTVQGYVQAITMVEALRGMKEPTRKALMDSVLNMNDVEVPLLLPGIKINTSPECPFPVTALQAIKFNGTSWELVGEPVRTKPLPACKG